MRCAVGTTQEGIYVVSHCRKSCQTFTTVTEVSSQNTDTAQGNNAFKFNFHSFIDLLF